MSRIHLQLPDRFQFTCELPVRVSDLNYGGHVGNDSMLTLMQEARVLFYRHLGFESEVQLEGTIGQIIADAAVVYRAEAFLGDVLVIEIAAADFNKYGFDLLYRVTNKSTGKEVARGKTGVVCFDYGKRKLVGVPEPLSKALQT
ncbi:thioesterase family protein [Oscillatoria amoena NRMC-F 0135]|nr:thioesterase family protein [Oscillatoria amoena NRMC-F 0135]